MTIGAIGTNLNYTPYTGADSYTPIAKAADTANAAVSPFPSDKNGITAADKNEKISPNPDENIKPGKSVSPADCQTCKQRKYQDGSNESNVSFKAAAHISPNAAGAAVRAHESQHVKNAYNKAEKDNGKVLSATVSIHTAVCPECGRTYVSGGTTNTAIKYTNEENPYQKNRKSLDAAMLTGANINVCA